MWGLTVEQHLTRLREKALATWRDVGAMLNIVGRPEPFGRDVVPLIEQGLERLTDDRVIALKGRRVQAPGASSIESTRSG